jgi:hypothetical protein
MAAGVTRLNQDLSGRFQSDGHLFAGNAFNTGGGPINIISNSMSDTVVLLSLVCSLSRTT